MFSLHDKVAVITGAASGIGLTTARRLAAAGATVVLSDITDATGEAEAVGGSFHATDVTDEDAVAALVGTTIDRYGQLDILVNNAGVLGPGPGIIGGETEELRELLEINLVGAVHSVKHAAEVMEPGSTIINTSSMAGVVAFPGLSLYGITKWGMVGLTKHAAVELGPRGIRVNCVCPSGVSAPTLEPSDAWEVRIQGLANQHLQRQVVPEEVAAAIHYLASDEAAMINGHALAIDGGLTSGLSVRLIEAAVDESIMNEDGTIARSS